MGRLIFIVLLLYIMEPLRAENPDTLKFKAEHTQGLEKLELLQSLTKYYLSKSADSCVKYGSEAIALSKELKDIKSEALANKRIGYACYLTGDFGKSIFYYQKAYQLNLENSNYLNLAEINNLIGDTYVQLGDYNKAMANFIEAEQSCDTLVLVDSAKTSVKKLYSILYTNLGMLFYKLDSVDSPMKYFRKALDYAKEINDSIRFAALYCNIGMVYNKKQQTETALDFYFKALTITRIIGNKHYEKSILNNIANIYATHGQVDSAMIFINIAKELAVSLNDRRGISLINRAIAGYYSRLHQYDKALNYIQEALTVSESIGAYQETYFNLRELSDIYDKLGNDALALYYYKRYTSLKDSVTGQETRQKIAEIQTRFETEKKEKENLELKRNNDWQNIQLLQNKRIIRLLIGCFVMAVVFITGLIYLYRKSNLAFKNLVVKNLELAKCDRKFLMEGEILDEIPNVISDETLPEIELVKKFNRLMAEEKPYLFSHTSIEDVAAQLNTNRTYLSNALNHVLKTPFSFIINDYRVKTARQLLTDNKYHHISIEGIGEMAGYSNRATFHTNFKKISGITPDFFRSQSSEMAKSM